MTYTDLEKLISKIISDDTVKDKPKAVVSKIREEILPKKGWRKQCDLILKPFSTARAGIPWRPM